MTVKETIEKQGMLLFDGGMGTYFSQLNHAPGSGCELASLSQPELIARIHREYLEAGAQAIKTNTFAVSRPAFQGDEELAERTIRAAWRLASDAAAPFRAFVFADIGPIDCDDETQAAEYCWVIDRFLELGAQNFLFETHADSAAICAAAEYIKAKQPESYVIASFAVQPDGFSRDGVFASVLLNQMRACPAVDAAGFNCVCGARHMLELVQTLDCSGLTLALMPNAGYPEVRGSRTFYHGDPAYFADQLVEMARGGAAILGGCCGTTPAHIAAVAKALAQMDAARVEAKSEKQSSRLTAEPEESAFWQKLQRSERVFAVELDPPADANLEKFMTGAKQLRENGADLMTIADCPIARARMDSSLLACKVHRELGMEALPHMTCRDRNLNATKALLLGLYAEGIRNVLLVTGDPVPTAERDEVKSVYQFNSRKLAAFVSGLGEQLLPSPFHLFGALNVNAVNFDVQLRLAKEKLDKGIVGFLTQPVLTQRGLDNLKRAHKELTGAYILGGIIPVVSARNARFMDSEINGIDVDPRIAALYEGKNREEGEELAVKISAEIARQIAPYVHGYYLMTPFQRTGLMCRIMEAIRKQ